MLCIKNKYNILNLDYSSEEDNEIEDNYELKNDNEIENNNKIINNKIGDYNEIKYNNEMKYDNEIEYNNENDKNNENKKLIKKSILTVFNNYKDYENYYIQNKNLFIFEILEKKTQDIITKLNKICLEQSIKKNNYTKFITNKKYNYNNYNNKNNYYNKNENYNSKNKWVKDVELNNFKPTIIKINKEGIEKQIIEIRTILNKISDKTYENSKDKIIEIIKNIEPHIENLEKIIDIIFEIALINKFYSNLYSNLYKSLIINFENEIIFKNVLNKHIDTYILLFNNIKYVDSNEDYDKYCEYIKEKDKIKSTTLFIINLMKNEIIDKIKIIDIIILLFENMNIYILLDNYLPITEEITENIFIIISNTNKELSNFKEWNEITNNIIHYSKLKMKDYKSLSNRSIFKYMDMIKCI